MIFPGISGSLLVQQFGLGAPITGARARPPAWEPRSHKLHGAVKKRKEEGKSNYKGIGQGVLEDDGNFCILTEVVVIQIYTYTEFHRTAHHKCQYYCMLI